MKQVSSGNTRFNVQFVNDRVFRVLWIACCTVGYTVGILFSGVLLLAFPEKSYSTFRLAYGLSSGVIIGGLQWFLLRGKIPRIYDWILESIVGFSMGDIFGHTSFVLQYGWIGKTLVFALCIGLAQAMTLQSYPRGFWIWVGANLIGWVSGLWFGHFLDATALKFLSTSATGIVVGVVTGEAMLNILITQPWLTVVIQRK